MSTIKPSQLRALLAKTIPAREPVLITGKPGIGKTDVVMQACAEASADSVIMHPVVSDPTDFKGLPWVTDGGATFLPFGELQQLINAKTLTACFLDDLGQAPPSVQAAAMQLILARRVNGHTVSPHVVFLAATNGRKDRAGVSGILEPVKSRFATIVELAADVNDWCAWAASAGIAPELIGIHALPASAAVRLSSDRRYDQFALWVENGETFIHRKDGRMIAEIYANIPNPLQEEGA